MSAPEIFACLISSWASCRFPLWLMPISAMMIIGLVFLEIGRREHLTKVAQLRPPPRFDLQIVVLPVNDQPSAVIAIDIARHLWRVVFPPICGEVFANPVE